MGIHFTENMVLGPAVTVPGFEFRLSHCGATVRTACFLQGFPSLIDSQGRVRELHQFGSSLADAAW